MNGGGGGCSGGGLWCVCIGAGVCACSVPWKLWWVGCCGGGLRFYRSKRVFLSSHFNEPLVALTNLAFFSTFFANLPNHQSRGTSFLSKLSTSFWREKKFLAKPKIKFCAKSFQVNVYQTILNNARFLLSPFKSSSRYKPLEGLFRYDS